MSAGFPRGTSGEAQQETGQGSEPAAPRSRRRRIAVSASAGVAVLALVGAAAQWLPVGGSGAGAADEPPAPVATAEVTRGTITATEAWDGTLGRGAPFTATAAQKGTFTRVAEEGSEVKRGTELYRVDERPVVALVGGIPMYRNLAPGVSGADVKQLEENLAELGYGGFTVDRHYTGLTANAVRAWQADTAGLEETGTVGTEDVVFVPEGGTVAAVHADVGNQAGPGSEVVDVAGSDPVATLEVDAADRDLAEVDTEVAVELPGGERVDGIVTAANAVQDDSSDGGGGGGGADESTVEVEIALADEVDESLLGSSVDVIVDVDEKEDVLIAPVNALLALSEGGHGLEVVADDGTTSLVPVETGLFDDGGVEVEGDGIDEGTIVGVAGR